MRLIIAGAGGVGGYFGAKLARAGLDVTFLARGRHLEALRRRGLRICSRVEGEYSVPVRAVEEVAAAAVDAVVLCVKSFDTEAVLHAIRPAIGTETAVLSLQNGVDSIDTIDAILGPGHAIGGAAYVFAAIQSPGVIEHRFAGHIVLGEPDGAERQRTRCLAEVFRLAHIPTEISGDIRRVLWEKYLLISAQAGMTAITRCPTRVLREIPECWQMYRTITEELAAVARAANVTLSLDAVEQVMQTAATLDPETSSSLHHDLVHGNRLELEALHGHAVRLGRRFGVATPTIFAVYAALKPYAAGSRG